MTNNMVDFHPKESPLLNKWENVAFYIYEATFYSDARMTCICCFCKDVSFIENNWRDVMDLVTYDYMTQDLDNFEIWNLYLVFISPYDLDKSVKYTIENDKFSMRKLCMHLSTDYRDDDINNHIIDLLNNKLLLKGIELDYAHDTHHENDIKISEVSKDALTSNIFISKSYNDIAHRKAWIQQSIDKRVKNEN